MKSSTSPLTIFAPVTVARPSAGVTTPGGRRADRAAGLRPEVGAGDDSAVPEPA